MNKQALIGKTFEELKEIAVQMGMPAFTAKQLANWLYVKNVSSIEEMTNLSLAHRKKLSEHYEIGKTKHSQKQISKDGTIKYLFPVMEDKSIEAVYIPDKERATLCISTQVGCKMNCLFCMTGKQGFAGHLSSTDIINQILSLPEKETLTNIVFMGMGEPLDNVDELFKALEIITADCGFAWSPKRVTVSTVGVLPGLKRFLVESNCHLAISIHSPYPDERLSLMPLQKAYPISDVLDLIRQYDFSHQRRVSFEYILFGGLNDDLQHARDLAKLLSGIPCRVNLIKYHAIPNINLKATDASKMETFRDYLSSKGIIATIRSSRGEDILAACGMLSSKDND